MDEALKHLELILGAVNQFGVILVFPVSVLWAALDRYFVSRERLLRRLYDDVRRKEGNIDPSMDVGELKSTVRLRSLRAIAGPRHGQQRRARSTSCLHS